MQTNSCNVSREEGCRYGRARYQDGSTYEGDWKQDHRWGWGKHRFAAGGEYEGEWDDDKMSGDCFTPILDVCCATALLVLENPNLQAWQR